MGIETRFDIIGGFCLVDSKNPNGDWNKVTVVPTILVTAYSKNPNGDWNYTKGWKDEDDREFEEPQWGLKQIDTRIHKLRKKFEEPQWGLKPYAVMPVID